MHSLTDNASVPSIFQFLSGFQWVWSHSCIRGILTDLSIPFRIPVKRGAYCVSYLFEELSIPFRIPDNVGAHSWKIKVYNFQFLSGFQITNASEGLVSYTHFQFRSGFQRLRELGLDNLKNYIFQFLSGFQRVVAEGLPVGDAGVFQFLSGFQAPGKRRSRRGRIYCFQFLSGFQKRESRKVPETLPGYFQFLSGFQKDKCLGMLWGNHESFNSFPDSSLRECSWVKMRR